MIKNIAEIISLQSVQKITKISAKCENKDHPNLFHRFILSNKYLVGMCKNCNNFMHNNCKSKNKCVLCHVDYISEIYCKVCLKYTRNKSMAICYECNKILAYNCMECKKYKKIFNIEHDKYFNVYCNKKCYDMSIFE